MINCDFFQLTSEKEKDVVFILFLGDDLLECKVVAVSYYCLKGIPYRHLWPSGNEESDETILFCPVPDERDNDFHVFAQKSIKRINHNTQ